MGVAYGRQPWPPVHGLAHAIVAGPVVPAPQYSCSVLQSAPGPQFGQLLQSQVSTHAPSAWQCASETQACPAGHVVVAHGSVVSWHALPESE
jgi:hypothetical protein